jgi:cell division protein FtsQ
VPLFPKAKPKAQRDKIAPPKRDVIRKESRRLAIQEKNSRAAISRIRPRVGFGKKVLTATVSSVALLAILVTIAVVSPLLAVREIEVVGTNRVSKESILKDLKSLQGKPLPQITSEELAARLSKYQLLDSVAAVALPPSKLRVVVVERSAISIVNINAIAYLYDAAGVQLGRAKSSDKLPVIENAGNPSSSAVFKAAIKVVLNLPLELLPKVQSISATSKDDVSLKLRSLNQRILWGDDSDPALKAKVLSALMNHYKNRYGQTFDVSSPSQPSVY